MTGGYKGNGVAVGGAGTWVIGTPVEPQVYPGNRQAATWVAREAYSPHQYAYVNNPTTSASHSVSHSNGAGSNPYVVASPVPPAHSSANSSGRRKWCSDW